VRTYARDCARLAGEVPSILKEMLRQVGNMLARDGTVPAEQIRSEIDGASFREPAAGGSDGRA
jgi:hypothetical protein